MSNNDHNELPMWARERLRMQEQMGELETGAPLRDPRTWGAFLVTLLLAVGLMMIFLQFSAVSECAQKGRAGKWTPWTGTVCYGEQP